METKTCKICTQNLPLDSFQPRSKQCKKCLYQKKKGFFVEYYNNNKEKICNSAKELYKKKTKDVPKQKRGRKPKPKEEEIELKREPVALAEAKGAPLAEVINANDSDEIVHIGDDVIEVKPQHIKSKIKDFDLDIPDEEWTCRSETSSRVSELDSLRTDGNHPYHIELVKVEEIDTDEVEMESQFIKSKEKLFSLDSDEYSKEKEMSRHKIFDFILNDSDKLSESSKILETLLTVKKIENDLLERLKGVCV